MSDGLFRAAVASADPAWVIQRHLPAPPGARTIVIGAGKASAAMAADVERAWSGPPEGLVRTRYGHAAACEQIEIVEAAYPVPDRAGLEAADRILQLARSARPDDLVLCLISGGASSRLGGQALPCAGVHAVVIQGGMVRRSDTVLVKQGDEHASSQ